MSTPEYQSPLGAATEPLTHDPSFGDGEQHLFRLIARDEAYLSGLSDRLIPYIHGLGGKPFQPWLDYPQPPALSHREYSIVQHDVSGMLWRIMLAAFTITKTENELFVDTQKKLQISISMFGVLSRAVNCATASDVPPERQSLYSAIAHEAETYHRDLLDPDLITLGCTGRHYVQSLMRQLLSQQPLLAWYDLRHATLQFLNENQIIEDKNTKKAVVPNAAQIEELGEPIYVTADIGDVFRAQYNLLRDVAGHGSAPVNSDTVPSWIEIHSTDDWVTLSVSNPGRLDDEQLGKIGTVIYSRHGGRDHGYGKMGITDQHRTMLRAARVPEDQIRRILADQWHRTEVMVDNKPVPGIRWQMQYPKAA